MGGEKTPYHKNIGTGKNLKLKKKKSVNIYTILVQDDQNFWPYTSRS